ncbi:hypothetical protein ABKN59_009080 [Abortiporus biennis]
MATTTTTNEKAPPINDSAPHIEGEGEKTTDSKKKRSFWDIIPTWVSANIRSKLAWKLILRCWIASWVCFVILLPQRSLSVLGNAAFFALLSSMFLPASMPVQLFLFTLSTMVIGMLTGWGIGAAAMRGALAARNQVRLQASLQQEAQSAAGLANPDALFIKAIFKGQFLDTNSSIVFGCFLGFGTFIFALVRAYAPKLTLLSIFGTIAIDIFCSYGPLFPFAQYTLLNSVLTSIGCYVGVGLIVIMFVFPETMNHSFLGGASGLLGQLKAMIDLQNEVLESDAESLAPGGPLLTKVATMRATIIGQYQKISATSKFIHFEFSWGKWNSDDVIALEEPLRTVISRAAALNTFAKIIGNPLSRDPPPPDVGDSSHSDASSTASSSLSGDTYLLRQLRERNHAAELEHSVRLGDVMPVIRDSTHDLREACASGIASVQSVLININTKRYARNRRDLEESESKVKDLELKIHELRAALEDFKHSKRLAMCEPYQALVASRKTRKEKYSLPLRTLYIAYVLGANFVVLAEGILDLMDLVQTKAKKRKNNRLWAPSKLRAIGKALMTREGDLGDQTLGEEEVSKEDTDAEREAYSYKLDPDSRPPTNFMQRIANGIHTLYKWTKTPEAIFTFKYVVVSICLWLPSVFTRSAEFSYGQKGLWALIMAQTTMNIYSSDQIFNLVIRIMGTTVGAVLGLLNWYIGSAHSRRGNAYGLAASVAVFLVPIIFIRLFAPPQYSPAIILGAATWVLIMGYSWIDAHLLVQGDVGIGWAVAWRRWVLVMIGSAASFILMMLPPKSGRKAVRLRNAATISSMSSLYSGLLSAWINDRLPPEELDKPAEWIPGFREKLISVGSQIQAVKGQTVIAKWEGNVRGSWPFEDYITLANLQTEMVANLALLGGSLAHLGHKMRISFLQHTRTVNPHFISDVMATFQIVSQSLKTGEPIHESFHQNLLDRLHYHGAVGAQTLIDDENNQQHEDRANHPLNSFMNYEYMFYASAVVSVFQILDGLNDLRRITTRLCGEVPLQGFERWKDQFDRAHVLV